MSELLQELSKSILFVVTDKTVQLAVFPFLRIDIACRNGHLAVGIVEGDELFVAGHHQVEADGERRDDFADLQSGRSDD